jgi:hypothetical protein
MSNLSVKNRVKLFNLGMVGSKKGFNNLVSYQAPKNSYTNNYKNSYTNDEIPENFYVSPPNSPTGLNNTGSVASNVGSVESFTAPVAVEEDPVNYMRPVEHNYSSNIAAWSSRNTTKNKKYKTRANYNSKNNANLKAKLALLSQQTPHYNTSGEEHSAQYWQNKRAANAAAKVVVKPASTGKKWTVKMRKNRKSRKSRKNRK